MKTRTGFVSNSSSSSFVLKFNKYSDYTISTVEQLKDLLKGTVDFYNQIFGTKLKFKDVFGVITTGSDIKNIKKGFSENFYGQGESKYDYMDDNNVHYTADKSLLEIHSEGDFVVFSKSSNTIPYRLVDMINAILAYDSKYFNLS